MTARKTATRSRSPRRAHGERLKDEVYRQMFRLEASRPGAELDLALALLRGWLDAETEPAESSSREWLRKICPICLHTIEDRRQAGATGQPLIQ